jgi:CheY-like chemotaxis protein
MGGTVGVESTPGAGSTFRFSVRVGTTTPDADDLVADSCSAAATAVAATAGTRRRILVVEDNPTNLRVLEAILEKHGYAVASAANGQEAIATLADTGARPHLVLMDCHMPEMNGWDATQRLRQMEREHGLPRLPVVALTASAFPEDRDRCFAAGMDDYLTKPIATNRLLACLETWCGKDASPRATGNGAADAGQ